MRLLFRRILSSVFALLFSFPALATHQVGGQLEMRSVGDKPGHFKIFVTNYFEDGPVAGQTRSAALGLFRKSDNVRLLVLTATEVGQRQPVVFTNEVCARFRNQNIVVATFEADVQLNPADYVDPKGYYVSAQTGNRNGSVQNLAQPDVVGYTFYLEFPPLLKTGLAFANSSPAFGLINGEYVCKGEPFSFAFGGTDPDGDELRYSLVAPLDGQVGRVTAGPYPDVRWQTGFSATNAIPGSPTLRVDAKTGELSVTATQLGLYAFAVNVEEFRGGQKIGEVRREFQFLVIDCPPLVTPDPVVQIQNQPPGATEASLCAGGTLELRTTENTTWAYQWRRNGLNVAGATASTLTVTEPGEYTVFTTLKAACSKASGSRGVKISGLALRERLRKKGQLCADGGEVTLSAPANVSAAYAWFRDGQPVFGQTADSLAVSQPGRYWASIQNNALGCTAHTDTLTIIRGVAVPVALASAANRSVICPGESLQLTGSGGVRYAWFRNGQPVAGAASAELRVNTAGLYTVRATDSLGCRATSTPLIVREAGGEKVEFDSLAIVCGTEAPLVPLVAHPTGGLFDGRGVSGAQFSPRAAGLGRHLLTYTVRVALGCPTVSVQRAVVVAPVPTIDMPNELTGWLGSMLLLRPALAGDPVQFAWSPPQFLTSPTAANTSVVGLETDTTYTLRATNVFGCSASASVRVRLQQRIWVPEVFTPNGDGTNDVWELKGLAAYPRAELRVYDRWGTLVYRAARPDAPLFDGTLRGDALPAGTYAYILHPAPDQPPLRGAVVLVR